MQKRKQLEITLLILVICGIIYLILLYFITLQNTANIIKLYENDIKTLLAISKQFNYIQGIYLIPIGLFFVVLLDFLGLPSYKQIYKTIKKDLKNKWKNR